MSSKIKPKEEKSMAKTVSKETFEQTQGVKDRFDAISGIIRSKETELGALKDGIKALKAEVRPLRAYLVAAGIVAGRKRAKKNPIPQGQE